MTGLYWKMKTNETKNLDITDNTRTPERALKELRTQETVLNVMNACLSGPYSDINMPYIPDERNKKIREFGSTKPKKDKEKQKRLKKNSLCF